MNLNRIIRNIGIFHCFFLTAAIACIAVDSIQKNEKVLLKFLFRRIGHGRKKIVQTHKYSFYSVICDLLHFRKTFGTAVFFQLIVIP